MIPVQLPMEDTRKPLVAAARGGVMAHHKRRRAKNRRAGCLFCKPHKGNGTKGTRGAQTLQERRARISECEQRRTLRR